MRAEQLVGNNDKQFVADNNYCSNYFAVISISSIAGKDVIYHGRKNAICERPVY